MAETSNVGADSRGPGGLVQATPVMTRLGLVNLVDAAATHPLAPLGQSVRASMSTAGFPCTFVKGAIKKESIYLAHIDTGRETYAADAHALIGDFLHIVSACPTQTEAAMTVLLLDVEVAAPASADSIRELAWTVLRKVHEYDLSLGHAWPSCVPTNMSDVNWAYCLYGVRLLVNMTSSALNSRHSRNLGQSLILVIQPADGLHYIAPRSPAGDHIREQIRIRIDAYDEIPRSPALNNAGEFGNSDWRQFWLGDSNTFSDWRPPTIPVESLSTPDTSHEARPARSPGRRPRDYRAGTSSGPRPMMPGCAHRASRPNPAD